MVPPSLALSIHHPSIRPSIPPSTIPPSSAHSWLHTCICHSASPRTRVCPLLCAARPSVRKEHRCLREVGSGPRAAAAPGLAAPRLPSRACFGPAPRRPSALLIAGDVGKLLLRHPDSPRTWCPPSLSRTLLSVRDMGRGWEACGGRGGAAPALSPAAARARRRPGVRGAGGRESAGRGRGGARLAPPLHPLTFVFLI